jgi:hypothetical protein
MKKISLAILVLSTQLVFADLPQHIKNLTGCFKVDYRYYEDGKYNSQILGATERLDLSEKDGIYSLQHMAFFEGQAATHFREDWKEIGLGHWEQRIYGPDGSFRYQCVGKLELNQLTCSSDGAPKPRRDKDRKDYDVLDRVTTLQITDKGWAQVEINKKRTNAGTVVAKEVGWLEFVRTDEKNCK